VSAHWSEDDLTLYYYGEGGTRRRSEIERHLDSCQACTALYREIASTLELVTAPGVPERGDQYGLEVWQRIRHELPEQEPAGFSPLAWLWSVLGLEPGGRWRDRLVLAGSAAVLVVAAFVAGRVWRQPVSAPGVATAAPGVTPAHTDANGTTASGAQSRILLASVADHLDRSARVLTDIMNTPEPTDISTEQRWAEDLVATGRLYRQDARDAGETSIATVLDDLERNLLEIVHSPSQISAADLEQIRRRIDAAALLFKVRVLSDDLRQRDTTPADRPSPRSSTPKSQVS